MKTQIFLIVSFLSLSAATDGQTDTLPVDKDALRSGKYKITAYDVLVDNLRFNGSSYADPGYRGPQEAKWNRLGWLPKPESQDPNPVLTVTLSKQSALCGLVIGGRWDWKHDFVKSFTVKYKETSNQTNFWPAYNVDGFQTFGGPPASDKYATRPFYIPIKAKVVQLAVKEIGARGAAGAIRVGFLKDCTYNPAPVIKEIGCFLQMRDGSYDSVPKCEPQIFNCPRGKTCNTLARIWGSPDSYTDDSPICKAAYHTFGPIGGPVITSKIGNRNLFKMTFRNGVLSSIYTKPWPAYALSDDSLVSSCKPST